jgi:glycosyl transferase, family 25
MHAYVINLARSRDRRAYITSHLNKIGIGYELVTAIDGRDLDLADPSMVAPSFRSYAALPAGSAGAAMSHITVYRKIIEDELDMALVLEDDVIVPADLDALADTVGKELVAAEVALLSVDSREHQIVKMSTRGAVPLASSRFLVLPIDVGKTLSGGAYIITREACERMIKCNLPIRSLADAWAHYYNEGALDRVRCVAPVPVRKNPRFASTMGSYSLGSGVLGRLVAMAMRHRIPVLQQVMAYRRKRIYRQVRFSGFTDEPFVQKPSRLDLANSSRPGDVLCRHSSTLIDAEESVACRFRTRR